MNAHNSLLDNFSSMQDEFNSSNNRMIRDIGDIFVNELKDLLESLNYFNGEYLVIDQRKLIEKIKIFEANIVSWKLAHVAEFQQNFTKEVEVLKQIMCCFFEKKLIKVDCKKIKMNGEIKKIIDRICDFNMFCFEDGLKEKIYNFKSDFERENIHDEYCDDDFRRIIKSFEHSLLEKLRSRVANSMLDKQEIVSRHISKGYEIIDMFKGTKTLK